MKLSQRLSKEAAKNLSDHGYSLEALDAEAEKGNYGTLCLSNERQTVIRPATFTTSRRESPYHL